MKWANSRLTKRGRWKSESVSCKRKCTNLRRTWAIERQRLTYLGRSYLKFRMRTLNNRRQSRTWKLSSRTTKPSGSRFVSELAPRWMNIGKFINLSFQWTPLSVTELSWKAACFKKKWQVLYRWSRETNRDSLGSPRVLVYMKIWLRISTVWMSSKQTSKTSNARRRSLTSSQKCPYRSPPHLANVWAALSPRLMDKDLSQTTSRCSRWQGRMLPTPKRRAKPLQMGTSVSR